MVPSRLQQEVLSRLSSTVQLPGPTTWKSCCPFHQGNRPTLIVQFHFESVFCLECHYGAPFASFIHHLDALPRIPEDHIAKTNPALLPNDSYAHWLNEDTSTRIYRHIFLGKIKELTRAVDKLQRLIGKMKR